MKRAHPPVPTISPKQRFALAFLLTGLTVYVRAAQVQCSVVETGSRTVVPFATFRLYHDHLVMAERETDTTGVFSTGDLPPGSYTVEVSKASFVAATLQLVVGKTPRSCVIQIDRTASISGTVFDQQGTPLTGAAVFALAKPPGQSVREPIINYADGHVATVDGSGHYRLFGLVPGEYAVGLAYGASTFSVGSSGRSETEEGLGSGVLYFPSQNNGQRQWIKLASSEEYQRADFDVPTTVQHDVEGTIEMGTSGRPETCWLALTSSTQPALATAVTQSGLDGKFKFSRLPEGSYSLLVSGPVSSRGPRGAELEKDRYFSRAEIDVAANVRDVSIKLVKAKEATFVLRTSDDYGSCPKQITVLLNSLEDWATDLHETIRLYANRPILIGGLAPTRYSLTVEALSEPKCHVKYPAFVDASSVSGPIVLDLIRQ